MTLNNWNSKESQEKFNKEQTSNSRKIFLVPEDKNFKNKGFLWEEIKKVELSSEELELLKSLLSVTDEVFCPECVKISEALLTKLSKVTE